MTKNEQQVNIGDRVILPCGIRGVVLNTSETMVTVVDADYPFIRHIVRPDQIRPAPISNRDLGDEHDGGGK